MFASRKKLLLVVAVAGLLVKTAEFVVWFFSQFRYYNFVPGLDMETLLRFGEWGTEGNGFFFTPHRALVAAWWAANGRAHFVPGIVAVQALCGVLGAVLCADLALRFFRRDKAAALVCGAFYLLYGPFFVYEFSVLQEVLALVLILLAFYTAVSARSRRGFVGAGLALGLCVIGRPTAFLFVPLMFGFMAYREFKVRRRRSGAGKDLLSALGGACAVLCLVSVVNRICGGNWSCFFDVLPYSLEFNAAAPSTAPAAAAAGNPYWRMFVNAVSRAPKLLLPYELPENLNYHYLLDPVPLLRYLPGPLLLLPLALAGMVLLMILKFRRAAALLWLPLLSLALPLCVRDPIGRYRLTLVPYLILCGGYWFHSFVVSRRMSRRLPLLLVAAACGALMWTLHRPYLRGSDYLTHALALERQNGGRPSPESWRILYTGWERGGFGYRKLGLRLYLQLEECGRRDAAQAVLALGVARAPEKDVYCYYTALCHAERGDFAAAEKLLRCCRPEKLGPLAGKYHFLYGEALRNRGDAANAKAEYEKALRMLDPGSELAAAARGALSGADASAISPRDGGTAPAPPAAPSRR